MTTRRTFLAGLLASAAPGAAQPVPAQPVAISRVPSWWYLNRDFGKMAAPPLIWTFGTGKPRLVRWSEQSDLATWGPA